jgi:4'-phosphopantetheinyl transferase
MSLITLNNQFINNIVWEAAELCDFKISDQVDIWRINISLNLQHVGVLLEVLNPEEVKRSDKYFSKADRNKYIIRHGALRYILAQYLKQPAANIAFKITENGKPVIDHPGGPQINFNLSDSADWVLIAIAKPAVGIDVELMKPNFSYDDILHLNFSEQEIQFIKQQDSLKRFFLLWTRKEAILKATGIGLTDHLLLIPSLDGPETVEGGLLSTQNNWRLSSFEMRNDYVATVAASPSVKSFNFWEFDFDKLS